MNKIFSSFLLFSIICINSVYCCTTPSINYVHIFNTTLLNIVPSNSSYVINSTFSIGVCPSFSQCLSYICYLLQYTPTTSLLLTFPSNYQSTTLNPTQYNYTTDKFITTILSVNMTVGGNITLYNKLDGLYTRNLSMNFISNDVKYLNYGKNDTALLLLSNSYSQTIPAISTSTPKTSTPNESNDLIAELFLIFMSCLSCLCLVIFPL